jgi:hypothetical protein
MPAGLSRGVDRAGAGRAAGRSGCGWGVGRIISSAYVPVDTMPGWLQVFAEHQPFTDVVDAVRALTLGPHAQPQLGHDPSYYVVRALGWSTAVLVIFAAIAVAKYRRG